MKTRKPLFSVALFWEGVRQTRLIGILFAVLLALQILLVTILPTISVVTDEHYSPDIHTVRVVSGLDVAPLMLCVFCIVAPVLTLYLFRFLSRREQSDFYHSLCVCRPCLFLSFFAAVAFWLLCYLLLAAALGLLCAALCSAYLSLLVSQYLLYLLALTVAALAVSAGICLAVSVTGTVFSNLVLSALVLFLPQFFLFLTARAVVSCLPILSAEHYLLFSLSDLNIITRLTFCLPRDLLLGEGVAETVGFLTAPTLAPILYTLGLCLCYLVLACLLFSRRKSEISTLSAPSRKLQAVYRTLFTFAFFALFVSLFFGEGFFGTFSPAEHWSGLLVVFLLGVLLFCLYELFTTKRFKKLLSALPSFGFVLLAIGAYYGLLCGVAQAELAFAPESEQVQSISILTPNPSEQSHYLSFRTYAQSQISKVELTDEEAIRLVTERLDEQARLLREEGLSAYEKQYYEYYLHNPYSYTSSAHGTLYNALPVRIQTAGVSTVRYLQLTAEESSVLTDALLRDESYADFWRALPDMIIGAQVYGPYLDRGDARDAEAVYASAKEELARADFSELYNACVYGDLNGEFTLDFMLSQGEHAGKEVSLSLYPHIFPNTNALCLKLEAESQARKVQEALTLLSEREQDETWTFSCNVLDPSETPSPERHFAENEAALRYLLQHALTRVRTSADGAQAYVYVSTEDDPYAKYESSRSISFSFFLDESFSLEDFLAQA